MFSNKILKILSFSNIIYLLSFNSNTIINVLQYMNDLFYNIKKYLEIFK